MKTLSLNQSFRRLVLATSAFATLSLASTAMADPVVVTNGDISGGTSYDFSVANGPYEPTPPYYLGNYGNNGGGGPGLVDSTNLAYVADFGANYLSGVTATSADLILGFDFSGTNYRPTALTLTSNAVDFTGTTTFTFSYSTDNFTYTPFATVTGDGSNLLIVPTESTDLAGLPDDVYVEISLSNANGFSHSNSQIGRADGGLSLGYAFTVQDVASTPEPSTFALLGLGLALLALQVRRRSTNVAI